MPKTVATNDGPRTGRRRALALVAALLGACAWGVARCEVEGASMLPTLQPGDRILLRRRRPLGHLAPGTVVALIDPRPGETRLIVKRVTEVDDGGVTVLGDNPSASTDSRVFGPVDRAAIGWVVVRRYRRADTSVLDP